MRFIETGLASVWLIEPEPIHDERGSFMRAWCLREFAKHGLNFVPLQTNIGKSLRKGTIRGMHFQKAPDLEAKLIRCSKGAMFDVALDLRPNSPTYRKWYGIELTKNNGRMLYIPEQCAHGYQTLEEGVDMQYMASAFYAPRSVRGVRFDDPAFGIQWPLPAASISEQDLNWPLVQN